MYLLLNKKRNKGRKKDNKERGKEWRKEERRERKKGKKEENEIYLRTNKSNNKQLYREMEWIKIIRN